MKDIRTRIQEISDDKRARLAHLLQKKLEKSQNKQPLNGEYDVVILGGGLAGLTLARQIKQARPETSILVAEKRKHPVPEVAFKVGESTVELGTHYLRDVLGLTEHLETYQLPKAGLRCFFTAGNNNDIAQRVELGGRIIPPVPSHQFDRGRLENMLGEENLTLGVDFWHDCKVREVSFGSSQHLVSLLRDTQELTVSARWVVDASGRAGLLKRQLGLAEKVTHDASAVWFRIDDKIDVTEWSSDERWRARVPDGLRWLSTNHLMGRGYWVWLIPLPSGATSIGIVADEKLHPHKQMNRFERALAWLYQHEPQCAQIIDQKRDRLQDFRALKQYAYGCKRVFSAERWALTGEAGVFVDPLYSPGTDFIGMGNSLITDLIIRDLAGEAIRERVEHYNLSYINLFKLFLAIYEGQYALMGNSQVMSAKIVWDFAIYWAVTTLLFFHNNKLFDWTWVSSINHDFQRFNRLHTGMQHFFRQWDEVGTGEWSEIFVDLQKIDFLYQLHLELEAGLGEEELKVQFSKNIDLLEFVAEEMIKQATKNHSLSSNGKDRQSAIHSLLQNNGFVSSTQTKENYGKVRADLSHIWFD